MSRNRRKNKREKKPQPNISYFQKLVYNILRCWFPKRAIKMDYRPEFLKGLELDFFVEFEGKKVAIEVDGIQHDKFIPSMMGKIENFYERVAKDGSKEIFCEIQKIPFIRIKVGRNIAEFLCLRLWDFGFKVPLINVSEELNRDLNKHCRNMRAKADKMGRKMKKFAKSTEPES